MEIKKQTDTTNNNESALRDVSEIKNFTSDKIYKENSSSMVNLVEKNITSESKVETEESKSIVTQSSEKETTNKVEFETSSSENSPTLNESKEILKKIDDLRSTAILWRYIPIPENDPAPTKDTVCDAFSVRWGEVIAARARGKYHKHRGINCDDWYEVKILPEEEIVCIAVSDGVGSCNFSRLGAKVSCSTAVDYLARQIHEIYPSIQEYLSKLPATEKEIKEALVPLVTRAAFHAKNAVVSDFCWLQNKPGFESLRDSNADYNNKMAATLLLVVLIPVNDEFLIVSFQVGDGTIALINNHAKTFDKTVTLLNCSDSGEFAGQVLALTSLGLKELEATQRTVITMCEKFDALMIMTDGVSDDFFPLVPGLMELYFSLIANGIISSNCQNENSFPAIHLPSPLRLPSPQNQNVVEETPIQYIWRILDATNLSLEDLWQRQEFLTQAASAVLLREEKAQCILANWLDNYAQKGSFDDRTLVIVKRGD